MSTQVQHRRGTTAQHATFTGAVGEITVDTDKKTLIVHDGVTAGGIQLLRVGTNGNVAVSFGTGALTAGSATFSSGLVLSATDNTIVTNSSDGADTKKIEINGGGAVASGRGAQITLNGNEYAGSGGYAQISSGNVAGSILYLDGRASDSAVVIRINTSPIASVSSTGLAVTGAFSTTGNTTLGDASTDTLNVGNGGLIKDASGNVGIGVTPEAWTIYKTLQIGTYNAVLHARDGVNQVYLGVNYYYDGSWKYGNTGPASRYYQEGGVHIFENAASGTADTAITWTERLRIDSAGHGLAGTDNAQTWGSAAKRFSVFYAGTGTINTSDAREKTVVRSLTAAEINAAKQLAKEIGGYRWLASVEQKGDAAREHIGLTVQRAIEIMESNSLDPFGFGFICYDQWGDQFVEHPAIEAVAAKEAIFDEEGAIIEPAVEAVEGVAAWTEHVQVAGDRYSFRMDELNLFLARGFEARLTSLENSL